MITAALIAGIIGYSGRESYTLAIASTAGGSVIAPGEGTFTYYEGTVVHLVAGIEAGYRLVNWIVDGGTVSGVNDAITTITMNDLCSITANFEEVNFMVAAGYYHTVGLRSDGTVVAARYSYQSYGQRNVDDWTDITQVTTGYTHTAGLRSDGTVIAVGGNTQGQCNVSNWTNIIGVAAGSRHTVGLKSDGTLVAVGRNYEGQCDVDGWTNIVQVAAGNSHTVGVKSNGTVVAVGWNDFTQCMVDRWMLIS